MLRTYRCRVAATAALSSLLAFATATPAAQRGVVEGEVRRVDLENRLLTVRITQPLRATRGELEVHFPVGPGTRIYLRDTAEGAQGSLTDLATRRFVFVEYEYDEGLTRTLRVIAH